MTDPRAPRTTYPGNDEARALGLALRAATDRGQRVPCDGLDPASIRPRMCAACPVTVRAACGDYGRASRGVGTFGGIRLGSAPRPERT